ncbi:Hypothetical_protein [Hexamita inflata]|uniref:Hypothetical_protein n=1 Tax=Hexamita inflata TaxID=28002 RepID=A0AA86UVA6_9EUKA|nr:Hypothetical protein HINF_LOCUS53867 [Hexamita inflata]
MGNEEIMKNKLSLKLLVITAFWEQQCQKIGPNNRKNEYQNKMIVHNFMKKMKKMLRILKKLEMIFYDTCRLLQRMMLKIGIIVKVCKQTCIVFCVYYNDVCAIQYINKIINAFVYIFKHNNKLCK